MVDARIPDGYGPDDELDYEGPEPIWLQLAAVLVARIEQGVYLPRRPIPGVDRLVQEFGIARGTVRKTVAFLEERGYVRAVSGKGTFVTERPGSGSDAE
ncbi:GntR family transcriptional regulator [Nocardiopsis gilva YIM 90087]|uniref:GntR family transcriptional regulator n=1 Tax=Nocardiopsis gilva YIM 90087 TaxID=1235441 RepID=A0A223SCT6_9ACTN|nr:GntR family transcriptional regulator [Nocardiopsis gilva]ASU85920.1 GntR family transcriptional regulator [Nocardiopsis gilva YIM 90087]